MTTRRNLLKWMALAPAAGLLSGGAYAAAGSAPAFISRRPPVGKRKFTSTAVEQLIARTKAGMADPELAWMFENCFPNTLDTTVQIGTLHGKPDTFIVTGDIDAMWMRDSSAQVWPYVQLAAQDKGLQRLFQGLIHRQALSIRIDPYANALTRDPAAKSNLTWSQHDLTDMKPGVAERKWEIDSLCYPIRLAYGYWKATGDVTAFDDDWHAAMLTVIRTFREQQRKDGPGPYHFQRASPTPNDTQYLQGFGQPTRPVGMVHAMFRPSDDATIYPFNIPGNLFAVTSLRQLAEMLAGVRHDASAGAECHALADEIQRAVEIHGVIHGDLGDYWAYEVDGFGNQLFMDDANVPSLIALPYLGACSRDDANYLRTRAKVWSTRNPYFFKGNAAEGIGGPHVGLRMIWPMSIMMRALTASDTREITQCLAWLKATHAGTGFMHEAFDQDVPTKYTRSWFAWANSLFGELIVDLARRHPEVLRKAYVGDRA
ncbi:glycoside hydrolase family 125 protein [Dyella solisilvae]|uniref:Glycoside hydrolase family 125 protein n=1 Tax=Dyella solisilvae TaxID=1920168 RepID=A0A370K9Q6_9GAMM|nr:glycoside hydrolase family 125 protein [Dyella solisilvae]RDI99388.1 glycoside hydrolase family 125 protein [Dyella solisilvae]